MFKTVLIFIALFFISFVVIAEEKPKNRFPDEWHGTWAGKITLHTVGKQSREIPFSIVIKPIERSESLTWKLTYQEGDKQVVKDYQLIPVPGKLGEFQIDEQNDVKLAATLINNTLYSHFEFGTTRLTARYELRDQILYFEVTSAEVSANQPQKAMVLSTTITAVQSAVLKKK